MNRPIDVAVREWLEAEGAGREEAADRAFRQVAPHWVRLTPPRALTARIAATLAAAARPSPAWIPDGPWLRAAVAVSVVACGVALGGVSGPALGRLLLAALQSVATGVGAMMTTAMLIADTGLAVAGPLAKTGRTLGAVLADPWPVAILGVNVLVAAAAFAALRRVLSVREV